jgi:putative DNA primase/helicase
MTATPDTDTTDKSRLRERATAILDANPHLSRAEFAGALFKRTGTNPDTACALYAELAPSDTLADTVDGYYEQLDERGVYGDLGEITPTDAGTDTALSCLGNQDFSGWYRTDTDIAGQWNGRARPYALGREFDTIRDGLDRVLYATVSYTPSPWFLDAWDRYRWVEKDGDNKPKREWQCGAPPTPEYGDISAYAPFADIDLADDVKVKRPAGDVPVDDLEDALARYIDAFADLAGGRNHVFALDSVGGAYVMLAPTSTAPIATEFGREDRGAIFDELTDRLNEWLEDIGERVTDATGLAGVFEPDTVNHKNRLYKAPLSVHKSLEGVVTPIDPEGPSYEFTPFEDADSALVSDTRAWVDGFTGNHRDAVDAIVATLWPEYYADADSWDGALSAWLEDAGDAEQDNRDRDQERIPTDEIPDDLETTDDLNVIESKIEAIDVRKVAKDVSEKTAETSTDVSSNAIRIDPSAWRGTESHQSCFVDRDKFVDNDGNKGGGALKLVALDRGIINAPGDDLRGRDYWRAVNALRDEGYEIPYYEGENGRHDDVLRLFTEPDGQEEKKQQLARALFADRS